MRLNHPVLVVIVSLLLPQWCRAQALSASDLKDKPDEWFATEEGRKAVGFIISKQLPIGGWEKDYHKTTQPDWKNIGTIDNGLTYTEIRTLARAYNQTKDEKARDAVNRGLDFLFTMQYPDNGGWPQRFPLPKDYGRFITFNDHAMINVMHVMHDVAEGQEPFAFVDAERRAKAKAAFDKGVECVIKTQIVVNGVPTGWCQQYEPETLQPGKARTYELPAIAGDETAGVLKLLMSINEPTREVARAIHTSAAWLERSKVRGIRLDRKPDASLPKGFDITAVEDPNAEPLWARFYEIETNRPFFCGRDGVKKYSMNEIEAERRAGYAWLRPWGKSALEQYEKWKARHGQDNKRVSNVSTPKAHTFPPDIVVAADGSGQFKSVLDAVQSIPKTNRERTIILVKDGVYNEKVRIDASRLTLRGQSRMGTRIEFAQLREDFDKKPDEVGQAVVNVNGDDVVLENLTIKNTAGIVGPHSFAVFGRGDRTVIIDCDVLSEGADTVSLWRGKDGRYYHARCNFRGAVDFVCPRGWCYVEDCTFYETKATAALWHDGRYDRDMKFVLRNCTFDGVDGWVLARHHHDAQFYLLDCTFTRSMTDKGPYRVIYPIGDKPATEEDVKKNQELDKTNLWGERAYFHNCHRAGGGDYPWHADNLSAAEGAPTPEQVTAAWTFAGKWDPKKSVGPKVVKVERRDDQVAVTFDEDVTVKGAPWLVLSDGSAAAYASGSGGATLLFGTTSQSPLGVNAIDTNGAIIASEAGDGLRHADTTLP